MISSRKTKKALPFFLVLSPQIRHKIARYFLITIHPSIINGCQNQWFLYGFRGLLILACRALLCARMHSRLFFSFSFFAKSPLACEHEAHVRSTSNCSKWQFCQNFVWQAQSVPILYKKAHALRRNRYTTCQHIQRTSDKHNSAVSQAHPKSFSSLHPKKKSFHPYIGFEHVVINCSMKSEAEPVGVVLRIRHAQIY